MKKNDSEPFRLRKRLISFRFAFNGIKKLIKNEHNARIHLVALIAVILLGIMLKIGLVEWIAISIVSGIVFVAELFNSAIEKLADFIEPNRNEKIGLIKDYCAGAVLVAALISVVVGGLIFIPKIIEIIKTLY
ncbi:MAG: diacylglycerol kinase family protein [Bacteroidales bacterium]|nr:diacylglycerol kinase family protein [Bacteroidales bacterium]HHT52117.1 diacylglycerol kinase family protein [Bacteroidales bacterium]